MHNIILGLILFSLCLPGICLMSKFTVGNLFNKPDNKLSKQALFAIMAAQTMLIVSLAVAAGIYFGGKIGLADPFLEGLSRGTLDLKNLVQQVLIGSLAGIICAVVWIVSYYSFIRPRIDTASVKISEQLRQQIGIEARITSGGITEEIIFRWGLLSFTMWAMLKLVPSETAAFWMSIFITGIVFGLAHLPGNLAKGCIPSPFLIASMVIGNLWVSIICGYLFWQYGIIAPILVHMLFHILWYPWELKYNNQYPSLP